ncbi:hypothetical protein HMPREF0262_01009 [Clostridium sp. ATCC 29733]|nr:hypothetical protein HMPREF0262_01009 [Clostridium sp. ATCC 29733]
MLPAGLDFRQHQLPLSGVLQAAHLSFPSSDNRNHSYFLTPVYQRGKRKSTIIIQFNSHRPIGRKKAGLPRLTATLSVYHKSPADTQVICKYFSKIKCIFWKLAAENG